MRGTTPAGQTVNVSQTGFTITEMNGAAPTNGAPLSYPSICEGVHWGHLVGGHQPAY